METTDTTSPNKSKLVTVRVSNATDAEVRSLAARSDERPSVVLRRLLRQGLQVERAKQDTDRG